MKTNSYFLVLTSIVVLGCQSQSGGGIGNSTRTGSPSKPVTTTSERACFNDDETCFTAMPASQIVDTNKEYIYANPADFPTASLRPQYLAPTRFIDLSKISESAAISENFIVSDFMNVTHGRYGLFSPEVVGIMQKIRDSLGRSVFITSGYRSPGRNSSTDGSAQWSRHMYGDAVDFSSASPNYTQLQKLCAKNDASFTLIYATHIHCDWRLHALDTAFYDTSLAGHAFGKMALNARIIIDENLSGVTLGFEMSDIENDEGDLIYNWTIKDAQGQISTFNEPTVELPIQGAPYTIDLVAGGSIHLTSTWPQ